MQDINWFNELFLSLELWGYFGPIALVIVGYYLADKDKILGVFWFILECLVIANYLTLVNATPAYWWHIILLILGGLIFCIFPLMSRR